MKKHNLLVFEDYNRPLPVVFDHPKFGLIPCITSTADIYAGEEVQPF